jgi:DNA primase
MPGVDFDVLRAEVSMEQVLDHLNFEPTSRSASQWHGPCPVHGSTSPGSRSFSVNVNTGRYYCRNCQSVTETLWNFGPRRTNWAFTKLPWTYAER